MRASLIVMLLGVVGGLAQYHHGFDHIKHEIFDKRRPGNSDEPSIRSLFDKIKSTVSSALKAVDVKQIGRDMEDIKQQAKSILDKANKNTDAKRVEDMIIDASFPILHILLSKHSTKMDFTVRLLDRLADKLLQDKSAAYNWVAAIKLVADASVAILDDFQGSAHSKDAERRQATWGTYVNRGPAGTSGGISGSYTTSGGTTYGGHVDRDPFNNIGGGLSASHTWSHGDGSKTTLGGHVDRSPYGSNSGGISLSHTFGRRQVIVQGAPMQKRQWTTTGSVEHGPGGTNVGAGVSHTWSHENGSKTSVSGNVGYGSKSGPSGGISITHSFGKRSAE